MDSSGGLCGEKLNYATGLDQVADFFPFNYKNGSIKIGAFIFVAMMEDIFGTTKDGASRKIMKKVDGELEIH